MPDLNKWYEFRQLMIDALSADLIGSHSDTVLNEPPLDRFAVGILHPRSQEALGEVFTEEEDADAKGLGDGAWDPAVALSHMRFPSSAGMTFAVNVGMTPELVVEVSAARYRKVKEGASEARDGQTWERVGMAPSPVTLGTTAVGTRTVALSDGLDLYVVIRPAVDGVSAITVVLVNSLVAPKGERRDQLCWFQPTLTVRAVEGEFVTRRVDDDTRVDDSDLESYALLFRDVEDLAVGHGCAVEWDDHHPVTELRMTFLPWQDVSLAEPSGGAGLTFPMADLGENYHSLGLLHDLVDGYEAWIRRRRAESSALAPKLQATAALHLDDAQAAASRIRAGIAVLETDSDAALAFRLMNRAMRLQRDRQDRQRGIEPAIQTWRPFQLAFILLNLEGLTNPQSGDRDLADLLWFPTGGGKTEAYLGLIGYVVLLRRIRNADDGGVSVIMRYTLRLLTVQQFERAASLICALESIRKQELIETKPISLGLWVGQGATPNSVKDAKDAITAIDLGQETDKGNPMQLLRCPACGTSLTSSEYRFERKPSRMTVRCADAGCEYGRQLPVHLVDEDVYRERPSLVIGTVDKFAMMAWREEVRSLFSRDGQNPPPDLIIQDELHLISGPLGTMVGLYETAVDAASTGAARPKIVASTATIRRASQQVRAVFDREARQFPPPGLTAQDSYFAVEASPETKGTRRYVGVLAPSVSHTTLMVRAYAALLQAAKDLPADPEVRDAYWTLLGYFNSLRVLGGAYMQVLDDVPMRLKVVAGRHDAEPRDLGEPGELTSRVNSSEIPNELARLETSYPDVEAPDVVLATNMISVGLDVDRLGLMVVMGQPQATAEYIQSTSRVGRRHPGLVVVLYNAARSRDLSHYEGFRAYHSAMYRQVEATGATPFAARARDRGLHGVLIALVRLLVDGLSSDRSAAKVADHRVEVDAIVSRFLQRVESVAPEEVDHTRRQLHRLMSLWEEAATSGDLKYAGWFASQGYLITSAERVLKYEPMAFPVETPAWATMQSLRDVDATSGLYLMRPKGVRTDE
jgi:hypothetical protein